jgi:branched-chain amino acid transport system substrate-binding protein
MAITRRGVVGVVVGAGVASALPGPWVRRVSAAERIKIGAPANLTGSQSSIDQPSLNGTKLKAKELNDAGGVLGRQIELVTYDCKSDPTVTATVGSQLINQDKVVAGLGLSDSDYVLAIGPLFQKAGIPFVTPGATSPKLPEQIGDTCFLACFGDNVQAAAGAEFVLGKLKARNIYLLRDNGSEYTTLLARYFEAALGHGGGKIVLRDDYKSGDRSFTAQITKLKAFSPKPEVLFISAQPDDVGLVVKQMRQAGVTQPIVGGDGYDTPLLVQVGGKGATNVYFSTHAYMAEDGTAAVKKFFVGYKKAYGTVPENAFAALGYDGLGLIADAIGRAGAVEPAKIREALAVSKNYPGVTGAISYRPGIRVPDKTVTIIGVKAGKLSLAGEVTPSYIAEP